MKKLVFVIAVFCAVSVHAATDPNIEVEGNIATIKEGVCLAHGGYVENSKKYTLCAGGKYEGYVTPDPISTCARHRDYVGSLIEGYGSVIDELQLVSLAAVALEVCKNQADEAQFEGLNSDLISKAQLTCSENSSGLSRLWVAQCYLQVANWAAWILPSTL